MNSQRPEKPTASRGSITKRKAERITGLEVRRGVGKSWEAVDGDLVVASASHSKETTCLTLLVNAVYKVRQAEAFERDGHMCVYCGSRYRLSTHHIIFRSHGRDDRTANLETTCQDCHDDIHKGRLKVNTDE